MKNCKRMISNNIYFFKDVYNFSKTYVAAQALIAFIDGLSPLLYIIMPKTIIDNIMYNDHFEKIVYNIIVFAGLQLLIICLKSFLSNRYINLNAHLYAMHFLLMINKKAVSLDMKQLDNPNTHQKIALAQDIVSKGIGVNLILSFFKSLSSIVVIISTTVILANANIALVLIIAFFAILSVAVNLASENWQIKQRDENIYLTRILNYYISIMGDKSNSKEMKVLGFVDWLMNKYKETLFSLKKRLISLYNKNMLLNILGGLADWMKGNGIYLYLAYKTFNKKFTIGEFTQYFNATNQLSASILSFIDFLIQASINSKYIESYKDFMEMKSDIYSRDRKIKNPVDMTSLTSDEKLEIRLENVSFKYPGSEKYVLKNISYRFQRGKVYAIVGENGAGKSTLINLLCRLYEPTSGKIYLNNIPIEDIKYDQYKSLFSIVFQDFKYFAFTIEENISLNKSDNDREANKQKVEFYLEKAGLAKKITSLENGIYTQLDKIFNNGVILSGGENQKIALARALFRETPFIMLDEPSSAMDPIAEDELLSRFSEIAYKKMVIYISHRLTCVTEADEILFIKDQQILEHGSHTELMKAQADYAKFYCTQAKHYSANIH